MATLRAKRGTRALITTAGTNTQLKAGEPYLITDEDRLAIGLTTATYSDFAKLVEANRFKQLPVLGTSRLIAGDDSGSTLVSVSPTGLRAYFVPLIVPRVIRVKALGLDVTATQAANGLLAIYDDTTTGGLHCPGSMLNGGVAASVSLASTGYKSAAFSVNLKPGIKYWAAFAYDAATSTFAMRSVGAVSINPKNLGRETNATGAISSIAHTLVGTTLSNPAAAITLNITTAAPAVYLETF